MQFPNTWEEFEQAYGFEDKKEIYTNGSRLIQSFRVKQWLDHIAKPERTAKLEHTYQVGENWFCENCGQQLNAYSWETPQNLAELGNENAHVSEATSQNDGGTWQKTEQKTGEWIKDADVHRCSECHAVLEGDDWTWRNNYYCYHCGADMMNKSGYMDIEEVHYE